MATLVERVQIVEDRTDSLETLLARFIERTDAAFAENNAAFARNSAAIARNSAAIAENSAAIARNSAAISRLERAVERMEEEGARYREQAERDREQAVRDREEAVRGREEAVRGRKEAARDRQEAARERKEMNKRWGELANKMGTVVEDIVAPSVRRLARDVFDCGELRYFATRVSLKRSDDRSREREFDALYVGERAVLLNSTKSSPRSSDARDLARFLESGEFALYFPQYRELPIVPVFSSLSIPEDLLTFLTRLGIYALGMGDEAMQVLNLEAVRRRAGP